MRQELSFQRFSRATWFCQAPERPGLITVDTSVGALVPVFSSLDRLASYCGPVRWFSTVGFDLLDLVPVGYRFLCDPGTDQELILDPGATRRVAQVEAVL